MLKKILIRLGLVWTMGAGGLPAQDARTEAEVCLKVIYQNWDNLQNEAGLLKLIKGCDVAAVDLHAFDAPTEGYGTAYSGNVFSLAAAFGHIKVIDYYRSTRPDNFYKDEAIRNVILTTVAGSQYGLGKAQIKLLDLETKDMTSVSAQILESVVAGCNVDVLNYLLRKKLTSRSDLTRFNLKEKVSARLKLYEDEESQSCGNNTAVACVGPKRCMKLLNLAK